MTIGDVHYKLLKLVLIKTQSTIFEEEFCCGESEFIKQRAELSKTKLHFILK